MSHVVDPRVENDTAEATEAALQWALVSRDFCVVTDEDYNTAAQCLAEVKTKSKELELQRQAATKPLTEAQRVVNSWFRPALESLAKAEAAFKSAIVRYQTTVQEARKAALVEAHKAETAQQMIAAVEKVEAVATPKVSGLSSRELWKFEVSDVSQLPREYLVPDLKKIGSVVRTLGKDVSIPGIKTWAETSIAIRSE